MIAFFLGAGFSALGGVPLARGLFDERPEVDRVTRKKLVERVLRLWTTWSEEHHGVPEEYLAYVQDRGGREWREAVWYVSLVVALKMGRIENVGGNPTITRHNLNRTTGIAAHEKFWSSVFRKTESVGVLTTNYDVLAERGLRPVPRPRVPRPGFHYGEGKEELHGGGYPSYTHIQKISVRGKIPLLKLHGSISWSADDGVLKKYHDCRPAIRGDAAIVAPVVDKEVPAYLRPVWDNAQTLLSRANTWIFVGYSLPEYDHQVLDLLRSNSRHTPTVHVFDRNPSIPQHYSELLGIRATPHLGIPEAMLEVEEAMDTGTRPES
ncbi:MAG: SIR2 family protein [Candidatus Acidiferrales bacterium]